jgi:hypothetical protein
MKFSSFNEDLNYTGLSVLFIFIQLNSLTLSAFFGIKFAYWELDTLFEYILTVSLAALSLDYVS